ncbi:hypothetical protein PIB30_076921 [Stylosanthes scabra]|uniref:Uncharacterized protein n=1 Tax=Stylosanthes scabra TaxID=79078 RepID=A0ABU6YPF5_9FABA|nr:hypothetical protein [Stylosanthes scabra]
MSKPPYPQRLKAENKNKASKKEPKEEKGATNDSVKFQQIQKVPTMPYLPTIMGSNNKTYMITEEKEGGKSTFIIKQGKKKSTLHF